ncbi:MAG: tRNA dimethylallyltransferase, partial [Scardovia wiggsiae]
IIPAVQIGLDLTRENLDERINLRTRRMREAGFTNEVRQLRDRLGATAIKALGYRQIIDYCDGLIDEDEAYERIAHDTRRLARKQMGWFGRDPRIHWLDATAPDLSGLAMDIVHHADSGDYDRDGRVADTYAQHHLGGLGQQASAGKGISGI